MSEITETKHEQVIADYVTQIRDLKTEMQILDTKLDDARTMVGYYLLDRGAPWKDEEGYAMLIGEGERVSYDTKALDELLLGDPLKYGWLSDYRKKSITKASLKVK